MKPRREDKENKYLRDVYSVHRFSSMVYYLSTLITIYFADVVKKLSRLQLMEINGSCSVQKIGSSIMLKTLFTTPSHKRESWYIRFSSVFVHCLHIFSDIWGLEWKFSDNRLNERVSCVLTFSFTSIETCCWFCRKWPQLERSPLFELLWYMVIVSSNEGSEIIVFLLFPSIFGKGFKKLNFQLMRTGW